MDSTNDKPMDQIDAPNDPVLPEYKTTPMRKSHIKELLGVAGLFVILVGIGVAYTLAGRTTYDKSKAASATGTAQFLFSLPAGKTGMTPNAATTLTLKASGLGQSQVEGFQMIASITGSVPATMTFTPATVAGLTPAAQSVVDDANGKKLTVAFVTTSPSVPFNANNATVTLGTLSFVAPASGSMTITIDQMTSKILQSVTGNDILANQGASTFSVTVPATATPTVLPTALPTAIPTVVPTVRPTATATPTPVVTPRVTATPIATAIPTIVPTIMPTVKPTISPTSVPVPTSTSIPGTAFCNIGNISVAPYPNPSAWNTTGQFVVTNKATKDMTFSWSLSAWTNASLSKEGVATLQPGKTVTLGLGQICSQWSLNISCATGTNQLGYVVESNPSACAVVTPAPTIAATPRPTVAPTPAPVPGSWQDFWRRWFSRFGR